MLLFYVPFFTGLEISWRSKSLVSIVISFPEFVNFRAFDRKLRKIYRYRLSSPEISMNEAAFSSSNKYSTLIPFCCAEKSKVSIAFKMTSCRLNWVVLKLNWEFSIFARSSRSLIRLRSIVELKREFRRSYSHSRLSSYVSKMEPAPAALIRPSRLLMVGTWLLPLDYELW